MEAPPWFPSPRIDPLMNNGTALPRKLRYLILHPGFREAPATVVFRLALWKFLCELGSPRTVDLPDWGVQMTLPPDWRGISKLIFAFRGFYERELSSLCQFLPKGGVFLDIGSCYGIYALVAARLVGQSGRVVAFEPAPKAFDVLCRNVRMNNFAHVTERNIALSDRGGAVPLFIHPDSSRNSLGRYGSSLGCESVQATTLDEEFARAGLERVDMIKIDAEGAEELILRGGSHLLAQLRPVVLFEFNPEAASGLGLSGDGAWGLLQHHGYRFWQLDKRGGLQALASPPEGGNVFATP